MSFNREKSNVRFETCVNYLDTEVPRQITRTSTKFLGTRMSSLSLHTGSHRTHKYVPRLHRQATEIPESTPLGAALKQFAHTSLRDELSISDKSSALDELKAIMTNVSKAVSRNTMGLQFLPAVYALGFSHWQSHPEKRVVCYLPVRFPKASTYHVTNDKVLLQLPRNFPPNMNIQPKDLEGFHLGYQKFISSEKFYSLVMKILKRILTMKSIDPENVNFSSPSRLMEIHLQENAGWVGEIVPCIVPGSSDSIIYSCKPFHPQPVLSSQTEEINTRSLNTQGSDGRYSRGTLVESTRRSRRDSQNTLGLGSVSLLGEIVETDSNNNDINNNSLTPMFGSGHFGHGSEGPDTPLVESNRSGTRSETALTRVTDNHRPNSNKTNDANIPIDSTAVMENLSDIHWYPCNPESENKVFEAVSKTDGGLSATAMMIVYKMSQHDWRLVPLRCYDVQTAMFHDVDSRLDRCPRWQRDSLQHCVRSILSKLHTFARQADDKQGLSHFSVDGINLWSHWDRKQLQLAKGALGRLTSNDTSLVGLLCRTGGISMEDLT